MYKIYKYILNKDYYRKANIIYYIEDMDISILLTLHIDVIIFFMQHVKIITTLCRN